MKKLLLLVIIGLSVAIGYSFATSRSSLKTSIPEEIPQKRLLLRFAVVADSHNNNQLLTKALKQAQGRGINFVVALGDLTNVGTVEELQQAKTAFNDSRLTFYVTAGDHDLWDSRNREEAPLANFEQIFGVANHQIVKEGIQIVIIDNSDIYKGISSKTWRFLTDSLKKESKLRLVMAHKTPFHPESKHVMGEDSPEVAKQAQSLLAILKDSKVDGFFSGDLHFFAQFKDPSQTVKMTTIGAVASERNFQGPRFAIVSVFGDYSWGVEDVEIR